MPLGAFFRGFNRCFARATDGYVTWSSVLVRKWLVAMLLLVVITAAAGWLGIALPGGFVPEEDQGYMSLGVQLPAAASVQRTGAICDQIDAILKTTDGVQHYTVVIGAATTNFQEVSSSLVALDQLAGAEQDLVRSVTALEKAVRHSLDRYLYGLSSYLEVLDAEEKLFPAQNAQATARLDRLLAYVQLYKALGGGWNLSDATMISGAPTDK